MSKFSQLLQMIRLLEKGEIYKAERLADILKVSKRMVGKYADDIKEAGLPITSKPGPQGGYYLEERINKNH